MRYARRIASRIWHFPHEVHSLWWMSRLLLLETPFHLRLKFGPGSKCNVPVRSGGRGTLLIGANNSFGYRLAPRLGSGEILLQPRTKDARVVIGSRNHFSNNVSVVANGEITFGDDCRIGDLVAIYDCDFHEIDPGTRNKSVGPILPVFVGSNVWLGSRVLVLKGVTIGDNSVVAAASVVTKSIPANCVAAGTPAKVIRSIG